MKPDPTLCGDTGSLEDQRSRVEDELLPLVYEELHRLAVAKMAREPAGHTLQPTALVHETYLRLVRMKKLRWRSREAFFFAAALAMRRILIERSRRYRAIRHGSGWSRVALDDSRVSSDVPETDVESLCEALDRLEVVDARAARVVQLRFFVGPSLDETARVLSVSPRTVRYDWLTAKSWLRRELKRHEA